MSEEQVAASDLACVRAERLVFIRLSFRLGPGEALILRGPNGSGKSSLLRLLAGLARPEAGEITWGGSSIREDPAAHRARLHFIGHQDALKPVLEVGEMLEFWAGMRGNAGGVDAALAHFRLSRHRHLPCRLLSAGERKRLALARLVATPAELWLLDEPATSLDAAAEDDLMRAIAAHRAAGGRLVVASHDPLAMADAATLALDDYAPKPRVRPVAA
ncbi:MAG: heme ABC exporter ATP-binding protein CcmA [Stellaceae bacterium]